tara:strand:+ start:21 stop:458 length:438 start_codon:yes stop_codon:yes gene_type:complete
MTELRDLWDEYSKIVQGGVRNDRALSVESKIHEIQKKLGTSRYDFDKRWEKNAEMAKPTINTPPMESKIEKSVPTSNFTFEQAKARIGENDFALLEDCAMRAEAEMVVLARILETLNVDNQRNVARRGQAINIAVRKFEDIKNAS